MNDTTTCISRAATLTGFTSAVSSTNGVQLRNLPPMTTLLVRTRNSEYHIVVSSGDEVLVKGGQFFPVTHRSAIQWCECRGKFPQGRLDWRWPSDGDPRRGTPHRDLARPRHRRHRQLRRPHPLSHETPEDHERKRFVIFVSFVVSRIFVAFVCGLDILVVSARGGTADPPPHRSAQRPVRVQEHTCNTSTQ